MRRRRNTRAPTRLLRAAGAASVATLAGLLCAGCLLRSATYFARDPRVPMKAWEVRMDAGEPRECLLVMLPGLFDIPDQFFEHGFVEDAAAASDRCDLLVVDSHVGYFQRGIIAERLSEDVLRVARARGYREIWMVGISMGGLGALLAAERHPDEVRGIVLISPWLGDEGLAREVSDEGLLAWSPPPLEPGATGMRADSVRALTWLRAHRHANPEIHLGAATDDRWYYMSEIAADAVPSARTITVEGTHGWAAWRRIWRRLLRSPPWDPR
ncbi:MAG TPA: alpha/beta hydrolase [Sandaracinaceae bacterium LLY-WYZ-13_1]|nr:alpha/beta hydrolase [Sandaracinaceae bacterium LLY-WYZ-13_1]